MKLFLVAKKEQFDFRSRKFSHRFTECQQGMHRLILGGEISVFDVTELTRGRETIKEKDVGKRD